MVLPGDAGRQKRFTGTCSNRITEKLLSAGIWKHIQQGNNLRSDFLEQCVPLERAWNDLKHF